MGAPGCASSLIVGGPGRRSASCCCRPPASPACSAASSLFAAYPLALLATGFFTAEERALARPRCATPARCSRAPARAPRRSRAAVDGERPRGLRGRAAWTRTLRVPDASAGRSRMRLRRGAGRAPGGRGPGRRAAGWPGRTVAASGAQRVGPGGEDADRERRRRGRGACACRGRGCGGIRRSAAGPAARSVESWSWWTASAAGDVEACASRPRRGAWRSRTRRSRRRSRGPCSRPAAAASRRTSSALDCAQSTRRVASPLLCTVSRRCRKSAPASAVPTPGEAPGAGDRARRRSRAAARVAAAALGSASSAAISAAAAPGRSSESSFSSRQ